MHVPLLTENEIEAHLAQLPEWTQAGSVILRTYKFAGFAQAIAFVNLVAEAAEKLDHHPDITVRYSKVTLTLTTHDVRGLTSQDMTLAAACDNLAEGSGT